MSIHLGPSRTDSVDDPRVPLMSVSVLNLRSETDILGPESEVRETQRFQGCRTTEAVSQDEKMKMSVFLYASSCKGST